MGFLKSWTGIHIDDYVRVVFINGAVEILVAPVPGYLYLKAYILAFPHPHLIEQFEPFLQ